MMEPARSLLDCKVLPARTPQAPNFQGSVGFCYPLYPTCPLLSCCDLPLFWAAVPSASSLWLNESVLASIVTIFSILTKLL